MTICSITTTIDRQCEYFYEILDALKDQTFPFDKILIYFQGTKKDFIYHDIYERYNNIEVKYVSDEYKSHSKYYYAMLEYPDADIVMLDDDNVPSIRLLESLKKGQELTKSKNIICSIYKLPIINVKIKDCLLFKMDGSECRLDEYKNIYMKPFSGWGTLIPAHIYDNTEIFDIKKALKYFPYDDEGYIYYNSIVHGISTYCPGYFTCIDDIMPKKKMFPSALWFTNSRSIISAGNILYKLLLERGIDINNLKFSDLNSEI